MAKKKQHPNSLKNLNTFSAENQPEGRGRPKGSQSRSTILRKWLAVAHEFTSPITRTKTKETLEDHIVQALIARATRGDVMAFREIFDSVYGKQSNVNLNLNPEELQNLTDEELESLITKANR